MAKETVERLKGDALLEWLKREADPLIDKHGNDLTAMTQDFSEIMLAQLSRHLDLDPNMNPRQGWRALLLLATSKLFEQIENGHRLDVLKQAADVSNVSMLIARAHRRSQLP